MKLYYAETLNPRKACPVARYLNAPVEFAHINDCQGREPHARVSRTQPQRQGPGAGHWKGSPLGIQRDHVLPRTGRRIRFVAHGRPPVRWLSWDAQHFTRHAGTLYFQNIIKPTFGIGKPDAAAVNEVTGFFKTYAAVLHAFERPQFPHQRWADDRGLRGRHHAPLRRGRKDPAGGFSRNRGLACSHSSFEDIRYPMHDLLLLARVSPFLGDECRRARTCGTSHSPRRSAVQGPSEIRPSVAVIGNSCLG
jgi:glutathione S-transferase